MIYGSMALLSGSNSRPEFYVDSKLQLIIQVFWGAAEARGHPVKKTRLEGDFPGGQNMLCA